MEPFALLGCRGDVIGDAVDETDDRLSEFEPEDAAGRFVSVYVAEHDALVRLAALLLGSTAVAEDVVQEAFAKLHDRIDRIDNPAAWLRTVVVNGCRNERRRWAVARKHARLLAPEAVVTDPPVHDVIDSLRALPPRQRAVVVLRFYEDLPEADIAAVLGIRIGTVKSRLSRALARLREEADDDRSA
jgi:RNA polymerase sigma-70 factor (sigma-E family)